VAQVITELEQLYRRRWSGSVFLVDDNFIGNKKNIKLHQVVTARTRRM
jgi:hypothetical protein